MEKRIYDAADVKFSSGLGEVEGIILYSECHHNSLWSWILERLGRHSHLLGYYDVRKPNRQEDQKEA